MQICTLHSTYTTGWIKVEQDKISFLGLLMNEYSDVDPKNNRQWILQLKSTETSKLMPDLSAPV